MAVWCRGLNASVNANQELHSCWSVRSDRGAELSRRIRVVNTLPVDLDLAVRQHQLPGDVEIVNHVLPDAEIDTYEDPVAEVLLAHRPPDSLEHMPGLRWTQVSTAGVESVVTNPLLRQGLTVTNARGVYSTSIAEYVLWAVLDHNQKGNVRRLGQAERRWPHDREPASGRPLRGQAAVIVGYGGLGREVARLLQPFGVRVIAIKARPESKADDSFHLHGTGDPGGDIPDRIAAPDELPALAAVADILVVTLPLTPRSRGVVSAEVLHALPRGALIVNVGRGATVDESALLSVLDRGSLGAAYLDVFSEEPLPAGHRFWSHPLVTVTPHVSGGDWHLLLELFIENLRRYSSGEPLMNIVSAELGY